MSSKISVSLATRSRINLDNGRVNTSSKAVADDKRLESSEEVVMASSRGKSICRLAWQGLLIWQCSYTAGRLCSSAALPSCVDRVLRGLRQGFLASVPSQRG